jgi:hypothetical protein
MALNGVGWQVIYNQCGCLTTGSATRRVRGILGADLGGLRHKSPHSESPIFT